MTVPLEATLRTAIQNARKQLKKSAVAAVTDIVNRVSNEGKDAKGRAFRASGPGGRYSPSYERLRKETGRPIDKVNLTYSGRMLGNLKPIRQTDNSVTIGFSSGEERKKALKNTQNIGQFVDLSEKEIKEISEAIGKALVKDAVTKTFTITT